MLLHLGLSIPEQIEYYCEWQADLDKLSDVDPEMVDYIERMIDILFLNQAGCEYIEEVL